MPEPRPATRSRGRLRRAVEGLHPLWIGAGATMLVGFALAGALAQTGMVHCTTCDSAGCRTGICPDSQAGIVAVLAAQALGALVLTLGLSRTLREAGRLATFPPAGDRPPTYRQLLGEFLPSFLTFFGWGLVGWGALLPFFAPCQGPCVPPYVLQGVPLDLVGSGTAGLATGAVLFGYLALHARRAAPRTGMGVPPPGGPL